MSETNSDCGILSFGGYVPHHRLERAEIAQLLGSGGGKGTRSVASYDEDTTTMGFEAARIAWRDAGGQTGQTGRTDADLSLDSLWFATARPAYLEKTNACAIHAALRLEPEVAAADFGGAARSGVAALAAAVRTGGASAPTMVVASDIRVGLPTGKDEAEGGDAAAALLVGAPSDSTPLLAKCLARVSLTEEFVDRWRDPAELGAKQWEERFAESVYVPLANRAFKLALEQASLAAADIDTAIVSGTHSRSVGRVAAKLGAKNIADNLAGRVGNTGCAHGLVSLVNELEQAAQSGAAAGQIIALVSLIDGADVLIFQTTEALAQHTSSRPLSTQIETGGSIGYGKYLQWRELLALQPPNRLEPARPSASAAARGADWKFGFAGNRGEQSGTVHLPPARVSIRDDDPLDAMELVAMAEVPATIATFTVDRLVYSVSPPVVFAIVDFDGGGRLPVELTDVDVSELEVGTKVEMTFRRLFTTDGIHNYFWKARPVRG